MYQFYKQIVQFIGVLPVLRYSLRFLYLWSLRQLVILGRDTQSLKDILLTSQFENDYFIYGQSDLKLIFIIEDQVPLRPIVESLRSRIETVIPLSLFLDVEEIVVFKESEMRTSMIRSHIVENYSGNEMRWKSLIHKEDYSFNLKQQDHFTIQHKYIKKIEKFLFRIHDQFLTDKEKIKGHTNEIYNAINGLKKYRLINNNLNKDWHRLYKEIINFGFFKKRKFEEFKLASLAILDGLPAPDEEKVPFPENYPTELVGFCIELLNLEDVQNIHLTPALIQVDSSQIKGRVFVDVIIKTNYLKFSQYEALIDRIKFFKKKNSDLKYFFNICSYEFYCIKANYCLSEYPLRSFYRRQQTYSFKTKTHDMMCSKKLVKRACVLYLIREYMLFRFEKYEEQLLGSKFLKSLNIMYQYKLVLDYLEDKEFAISHNFKSILEVLGAQLQEFSAEDIVDERSWQLIRSQMLFMLKQIRNELAQSYSSLKNLQF